MAVQVSYPGVYIDEFAPGAPIEGVGTSTAAFLGVSKYGVPNRAVRITSWDAFLKEFWRPDEKPDDTNYLWYAVRGFFENGGRDCFVMPVSNAIPDSVVLDDSVTLVADAAPTIVITARVPGANSGLKVKAEPQSAVSNAKVFRPTVNVARASGNVIECTTDAGAGQFVPGDPILLKQTGGNTDSAVVSRVEGKLLRIETTLAAPYTGNGITVRPDVFPAGATSFRAEGAAELAVGSAIRITQSAVTVDCRVVAIAAERASTPTHRVTVDADISGFDPTASNIRIDSQEFKLTIQDNGVNTPYEKLAMDPGHPRYFASVLNNDPACPVTAAQVEPPNTTAIPDNRPSTADPGPAAVFVPLTGGSDHDESTISAFDFENALRLLERIDDINIVTAPGWDEPGVQVALISHCERMQDRFAILATPRGTPMFGADGADGIRPRVDSARGFAALYYPWLQVGSVKSGGAVPMPPTGYVAGIYARIDGRRGVFKAPAGNEATVNGALGVVTAMSDDEQGILNKIGVNVIRVFQTGGRPVVWGARTTATKGDTTWQYVNVRRLFLFLEESIQEGIRWAVFEPNVPPLWQKLKRSIGAFLTQQWRDGAIFGNTAEEAFYVRIDETLNPDNERALGRLYIEIGVRPAYPAEFIIVRIGIWQGGADVTE
jgi:phage tail sheath protein FI